MNISVEGVRTSVADWKAAQALPADQLPALSPAQKEAARRLHVSEEDYARSALAGHRTGEKLLQKTERFARWLQALLRERAVDAEVGNVTLNTWDGKFEVTLGRNGSPLFFKVDEEVVDSLFESGSADAEQRLARVLDLVLGVGAAR
jgi:hypothetical protein